MSAMAPSLTYGYARYSLGGGLSAWRTIPMMIALGAGMCLNNTIAVVRGLYLHGGEFVRTPKTGSRSRGSTMGVYRPMQTHMWLLELGLGVYSLVCFVHYLSTNRWAFSLFLLLYAVGFLTVGWLSRPRSRRVDNAPAVPARVGATG